MSSQIEVILTDGRQVRAVYGSKNHSHLSIVNSGNLEEYNFFLEDYFDLSSGELSSEILMKNIINGTTEHTYYEHLLLDKGQAKYGKSTLGAVYSYLVRDMCIYYGKVINRNTDQWPMLPAVLAHFENNNRSYFDHPFSLDFPHIYIVLLKELDSKHQQYTDTFKVKYPGEIELQKDLDFIFTKAKEEQLNIFFCNY